MATSKRADFSTRLLDNRRRLRSPASLLRDEDGAVSLLGILLGMLLVGVLWNVISVGDALLWRENAQDAADAVAMEGAIWHARGMNVLVMLNLIMAAVMMFLVIWRMLIMVLVVVGIVLLVAFGSGAAVLQVAGKMIEFDPKVSKVTITVEQTLSITEALVATTYPLLAAHKASDVQGRFHNIQQANIFSTTMLPMVSEQQAVLPTRDAPERKPPTISNINWNEVGISAVDASIEQTNRTGLVISLPVQEAGYEGLCEKAGSVAVWYAVNHYVPFLPLPTEAANLLAGVGGFLPRIAPVVFCHSSDPKDLLGLVLESSSFVERQLFRGVVRSNPVARKFLEDHGLLEVTDEFVGKDDEGTTGRADGTDKGAADKGSEDKGAADKGGGEEKKTKKPKSTKGSPFSNNVKNSMNWVTVAEPWSLYQNGNLFGQVWSFVDSQQSRAERDARGIAIADSGQGGETRAPGAATVRAQAEFYFDCKSAWGGCKSNAMWRLFWRARLRRVYGATGEDVLQVALQVMPYGNKSAFGLVEDVLNWKYADASGNSPFKGISKIPGTVTSVSPVHLGPIETIVEWGDRPISAWIESALNQSNLHPRQDGPDARREMIH